MNRLLSVTTIAAALFATATFSANAAPLSPQSQNATSTVEKVHGYHRSCRGEWSHRHQRDGDRVPCGRSYYYRDSAPSIYLNLGDRHRGHHRHNRHRGDRH